MNYIPNIISGLRILLIPFFAYFIINSHYSYALYFFITMCISGALAGLVGINELMGVQHRLFLNFNYGYGFGGIAVALMGRNHPVGILIAAFLFGILYQGGAELDFELQNVSRDIVVVMQGLVILFCGGLEYLYRPILIRFLAPIEGTE